MTRDEHIVAVIRALQRGEVTTYGDIADTAGYPKLSRLVGRILANDDGGELPWWRVVNSQGRLVPGHEREQRALLLAERVVVRNHKVAHAPIGRFAGASTAPPRARPSQP